MAKKRKPPRPVPVLSHEQESFLAAISDSGQFTLDKVLARHAPVSDFEHQSKTRGKVVSTLLPGGDDDKR